MGNSFNFRDVENDKLIKRYNIAASGVLWKTCSYGLNLEGICYNKECQAYKHRVIICVGYGTFSITSAVGLSCPCCHGVIVPYTCAFVNTFWKCVGTKAYNKNLPNKDWTYSGYGYYRFEGNRRYSTAQWKELVIITSKYDPTNECSICLSALSPTIIENLPRCNHQFCRSCIQDWKQRDNTCPLCRFKI